MCMYNIHTLNEEAQPTVQYVGKLQDDTQHRNISLPETSALIRVATNFLVAVKPARTMQRQGIENDILSHHLAKTKRRGKVHSSQLSMIMLMPQSTKTHQTIRTISHHMHKCIWSSLGQKRQQK